MSINLKGVTANLVCWIKSLEWEKIQGQCKLGAWFGIAFTMIHYHKVLSFIAYGTEREVG